MKNVFYVPRLLIKHQLPHPEFYGEILVELLNGMVTDVYTDEEDGRLFSITNDEDLIKYLEENKLDEPYIEIKNKDLLFRTILHKDKDLVLKWFNSNLINQYEYEMTNIIEFISHTISSSSHQFVINYKKVDIGLFGFSIINDEANFNFDVYELDVPEIEKDYIFKCALDYIDGLKDIKLISTNILSSDNKKLGLFLNNCFVVSQSSYMPVSETGYKKTFILKRNK
jgi:hypothetical protein